METDAKRINSRKQVNPWVHLGPSEEELNCLLESMLIPFPVKRKINKHIDLWVVYDGEHISEDWMRGEIATSSSVKLIYHIGEGFRSAACQTLSLPQLLFACRPATVVFLAHLRTSSGKLFCHRHLSDIARNLKTLTTVSAPLFIQRITKKHDLAQCAAVPFVEISLCLSLFSCDTFGDVRASFRSHL